MEEHYIEATLRACEENHEDFSNVDLSLHELAHDTVVRLAKCLASNTRVTSIDLFGVKEVTADGWTLLVSSLPAQLTHLDLGSCKLGGAKVLDKVFSSIGKLHALEELDLSGNDIEDDAILPTLCDSLIKLPRLHEFLIQNNKLGSDGVKRILSSLKTHSDLEKVWMQSNGVDDSVKEALHCEVKKLVKSAKVEL